MGDPVDDASHLGRGQDRLTESFIDRLRRCPPRRDAIKMRQQWTSFPASPDGSLKDVEPRASLTRKVTRATEGSPALDHVSSGRIPSRSVAIARGSPRVCD